MHHNSSPLPLLLFVLIRKRKWLGPRGFLAQLRYLLREGIPYQGPGHSGYLFRDQAMYHETSTLHRGFPPLCMYLYVPEACQIGIRHLVLVTRMRESEPPN